MSGPAKWLVRIERDHVPGLDLEEARRALALLTDARHRWELRALAGGECGGTKIFAPDSRDEMLGWVRRHAGEFTVYINLNPVNASHLGSTAKKGDMAGRHWLFLDIDPIKPEAHKDDSASDEEHERTRQAAEEIHAWLGEKEWPAPVIIDSGNGYYLMYRVDLPNTAHVQALLKRVGQKLAAQFNTLAHVDGSVHNANRLAKLPGVMARKGENTPDRPHRPCRIVHVPEHLIAVPAEMIHQLVGPENQVRRDDQIPDAFRLKVGGNNTQAYVRRAVEGEVARVALAIRGPVEGLNNALNTAAFNLGQFGGAGLLSEIEAHAALVPLAIQRGEVERQAEATFQSGWKDGYLKPRQVPVRQPLNGNGNSTKPPLDPTKLIIIRASEITPKRVKWLWPWRIPLGKLTTFAGIGGLGKTFVLCDITARVTTGIGWPDGPEGEVFDPGQVLFVSGEDDPEDTLVPRLIEVGADLTRVAFLRTEAQGRFTLADIPMLELARKQIGENVRFVAIDPPTAYLGGIDDHKNSELRSLLTPLAAWAAENELAIVFNTHVNKPQGKVEAMMRVMGSVAWVNAVRAGHMFARDPDDPEKRLFVPMKSNLGKPRKGLAYKIVERPNDLARVEWHGEVDTTADQAVNSERGKSRKVVASEWLVERFREKREWPSDELFRLAKEHGVSRSAIFEAKDILDLPKARRHTAEDGSKSYCWWVPENWDRLTDEKTPPGAPPRPALGDDEREI